MVVRCAWLCFGKYIMIDGGRTPPAGRRCASRSTDGQAGRQALLIVISHSAAVKKSRT